MVAFSKVVLAFVAIISVVPSFGFQAQRVTRRQGSSGLSGRKNCCSRLGAHQNPRDYLQDALRRMNVLQENEKLLRKQPIRVGPSSILGAGSGVFATKNIKAGTIVGFCPVHEIGLEYNNAESATVTTSSDDDEDNSGIKSADVTHNYLQYLIGSRPLCGYKAADHGASLFIDINPERKNQEAWISHFINDGATVTSNSEKGLLDYYRASNRRKNCVTIPFGPAPILATVTTCKVKKGDELFTTYGGLYWLESILHEDEEPVDISEAIQMEVKNTAQDLFDAMQTARATNESLETELEGLFVL